MVGRAAWIGHRAALHAALASSTPAYAVHEAIVRHWRGFYATSTHTASDSASNHQQQEDIMKRHMLVLSLSLLLGAALAPAAMAQSAPPPSLITEQEVQAIGIDAYLYLYSLVTMDLTRKQLTNVEPGKGLGGPMNMF